MKLPFLILFFLTAFFCTAQRKRGTLLETSSYSILRDNPEFTSFSLNLGVGFGISEINGLRLPVEGGAIAITPGFTAEVCGIFNLRFNDLNPEIRSIYAPEQPRELNFLFSKVLIRDRRVESVPVLLKMSQVTSRTSVSYYINVPATIDFRHNIDVGFSAGSAWTSLNYSVITGVDYLGNSHSVGNNSADFRDFYSSTYADFRRLKIGFSRTKVFRLDVDVKEYGKRIGGSISKFYGHFLFDFYHKLDDVNVLLYGVNTIQGQTLLLDSEQEVYLQLALNKKQDYNPFGIAVGYTSVGLSKWGLNFNFETGLAPGLRTEFIDKLYIRFSFGISVSQFFERDQI